MLAISGNVNYYRISTQFAITKLFCEQNFWPMDAFDFVRKFVDKMIFLLEHPFRSSVVKETKSQTRCLRPRNALEMR